MRSILIRLCLSALFITALAGCGGSDGAAGAAGAPGTAGAPGAPGTTPGTNAATMTAAQWASSQFSGQITALTINASGKPVVSFKITDKDNVGVAALGSTSQAATAIAPGLTNLAFSIAKLVPGANGSPSRWVSYIVTSMPAKCATTTTGYSAATGLCTQTGYGTVPLGGTLYVTPSKPSTDNTGTLVDNGDGTYQYTFYRSITTAKATVDGLAASAVAANANNIVADLDDLTYDANLTHRVGIQLSGSARGTGSNTANGSTLLPAVNIKTPVNITAEFVPATGALVAQTETDGAKQRRIVDARNCWTCHGGKMATNNFHGGNEMTGAGASRQDPNFCVFCHTDQRKYSVAEMTFTSTNITSASGDRLKGNSIKNIPVWIHKIHMGQRMVLQGYNATNVLLNEVGYPQDIRNCAKCHSDNDGATGGNIAPQADNWKNVSSRLICGSCHDGIDFATGTGYTVKQWRQARANVPANLRPVTPALITAQLLLLTPSGHGGGIQTSDANCTVMCHSAAVVATQHIPVTTPTVADANKYASTVTNLPSGAKVITYVLNSVTLNATRNPVYKFKLQADGADVVFNTPSPTAELMANFTGSTSLYTTFSVPQDGLAAPADWNAYVNADIRGVFRGTSGTNPASGVGAGTLAGPDASGYYTLTQVGAIVPANATNMTGWMGLATGLAQTNVAGYTALNVPAEAVSLAVTATGNVARRAIVEKTLCNSCHNRLGVFGMKTFHAGQRNNPQACAMCHRPNQTSGGWSSASTAYIHGIHGKDKRTVPFTWHTTNLGDETGNANAFQELGYPGILRNCLQCHLPNTVNFGTGTAANNSNAKWAYESGNVPYYTVGQNKYLTAQSYNAWSYVAASGVCAPSATTTVLAASAVVNISPYVQSGAFATTTDYGPGYAYNFAASGVAPTSTCTNSGVVLPGLAPQATREAADTTLVNSPIANACFACHTTSIAMSHMRANGGYLYATRAAVKAANGGVMAYTEQCIICHGAGRVADAEVIHTQTLK